MEIGWNDSPTPVEFCFTLSEAGLPETRLTPGSCASPRSPGTTSTPSTTPACRFPSSSSTPCFAPTPGGWRGGVKVGRNPVSLVTKEGQQAHMVCCPCPHAVLLSCCHFRAAEPPPQCPVDMKFSPADQKKIEKGVTNHQNCNQKCFLGSSPQNFG